MHGSPASSIAFAHKRTMSRTAADEPGPLQSRWLLFPSQTMDRSDMTTHHQNRSQRRLPFNLQSVFNPATAHKKGHYDEDTDDGSADIKDIPLFRERTSNAKKSLFGRGSPIPEPPDFSKRPSRRGSLASGGEVATFTAITSDDVPSTPPRHSEDLSTLRSTSPEAPGRTTRQERREVSFFESPRSSREIQDAIPIPVRSSSRLANATNPSGEMAPAAIPPTVRGPSQASSEETTRSRGGSAASSYTTNATSLPALQQKSMAEADQLDPLNEEDIDPGSFDLVAPLEPGKKEYSLEKRSEQLFSSEHLKVIFDDPTLLLRFTAFLSAHRVSSLPVLIYYLDAVKALKALIYANAIAEALDPIDGFDFTQKHAKKTVNAELEEKARHAFDAMVREDLPAYVAHTYIQTVSVSISRKITGNMPAHLRQHSEGLAEVFCLTDPSRPDNPIVFASEEFHKTTQYGMSYVLGRNCRFLQGPKTNPHSVRRLREYIEAGVEHCEVFLNYRRDGSPFMNLLMCAPLCDSRGSVRYFIGAQVDVSGLVKEFVDLESLKRLVTTEEAEAKSAAEDSGDADDEGEPAKKDEFQALSEMLNMEELDTVRRYGGRMHRQTELEEQQQAAPQAANWNKPRLLISDVTPDGSRDPQLGRISGKLSGIYENYLLIRPYPSLRVLFASPTLRVPGILQSKFMDKIGGSERIREELTHALADGRGVTAKVRWVTRSDYEGRPRWIHCTPLLGSNGHIGVWMVVIVDEESPIAKSYRQAPPVDAKLGRVVNHSNEVRLDSITNSKRRSRDSADWSLKDIMDMERVNGSGGANAGAPTNRPGTSFQHRADSLGRGSLSSKGGSTYTMRID